MFMLELTNKTTERILQAYIILKNAQTMLTIKRKNIIVEDNNVLAFFLPDDIQKMYQIKKCSFVVPKQISASEVFRVEITFKNGIYYAKYFTSETNTSFTHKKKAMEALQPKVEKAPVVISSIKVIGIDPGLNKWMTCVDNLGNSFIITSKIKTIEKATKAVALLIKHCKKENISHIVLGNNGGWNECSISRKLKSLLMDKSMEENITVEVVEEDFTTQVDFLSNANFSKTNTIKVKNGLDKDCNAAANMMRKSKRTFDFSFITKEQLSTPSMIKV